MKLYTVPTITRAKVNALSRDQLTALDANLRALWHFRKSLSPTNQKRLGQAMRHCGKRSAQLKRELTRDWSYKTSNRKPKQYLSGTPISAYAEALGVTVDKAEERVRQQHIILSDGPPVIANYSAS